MISSQEIRSMFMDSLFKPEELPASGTPDEGTFVRVEGIVGGFGFHPERVKTHAPRLKEIIAELDPNFLVGWTFLNLPFDKNGNQWGEQPTANEFMCLSMANGLARYQFPREMWEVLPGGVPYVQFTATGEYQALNLEPKGPEVPA